MQVERVKKGYGCFAGCHCVSFYFTLSSKRFLVSTFLIDIVEVLMEKSWILIPEVWILYDLCIVYN